MTCHRRNRPEFHTIMVCIPSRRAFSIFPIDPRVHLYMKYLSVADASSMLNLDPQGAPQTYIIARDPAVLAQLMRENENRPLNPSAYTTPASVFNTVAVDIDSERAEPIVHDAPAFPLKTIMLPASEILKLDPVANHATAQPHSLVTDDEESAASKSSTFDRYNLPQDALMAHDITAAQPPQYPVPCEIISALTQQIQSLDPNAAAQQIRDPNDQNHRHFPSISHSQSQIGAQLIYSNTFHVQQPQSLHYIPTQPHTNLLQKAAGPCSASRPPHCESSQKSRSLERNTPPLVAYSARISSLERMQNAAKQSRSNSLTRHFGSGDSGIGFPPVYAMASRSASLERSASAAMYSNRTKSLERQQQTQLQTAPAQFEQLPSEALRGGSLERNQSAANSYEVMKMRGFRSGSLDRNNQPVMQYQMYREQFKQPAATETEPFQEEIYDFGGANVKSCASIALNKSISKGLIPPGTTLSAQHAALQHLKQQQKSKNVDEADGLPPMPQPTNPFYPPPKPTVQSSAYNAQHASSPNAIQQSQSYQNYSQANSTYTPMYPRMWSGSQQQMQPPQASVILSQGVHLQQSPKYAQNVSSGHTSMQQPAAAGQNTPQKMAAQMATQSIPLSAQQPSGGHDATAAPAQVCRFLLRNCVCLHRFITTSCFDVVSLILIFMK